MSDTVVASVDAFERALEAILARVSSSSLAASASPAFDQGNAVAVAYSGGLDSTVLLHLVREAALRLGLRVVAFHVHHGLSPNADRWGVHCAEECARIGVPFEMTKITLPSRVGGVEQAARHARYAALGTLCSAHKVPLLLTAHHQSDQAETVLLQLLRGSGVAGLSGMSNANQAPALLGSPDLWMGRPLLALTRKQLEDIALERGIRWVEDESNADTRYARNSLRHVLMPVLAQQFPGFEQRLARTARHAQSAQRLLLELAIEDMKRCAAGDGLSVSCLQSLGDERADNLLRYWFASRGLRMPSTAWLAQLRIQVQCAGDDARVRIVHPDCEVWRYRGRLLLAPRLDEQALTAEPVYFRWQGQSELAFPAFHGRLVFETAHQGIDAAWLRKQELVLRHRSGGERIRLGPNRPTRDLKHQFQALGIPPWERCRLPMVMAGTGLLFAAQIGMNWAEALMKSESGIVMRWIASLE